MLLEPYRVPTNNLGCMLDALEDAIAGKRSLLPLPPHDAARAGLLCNTLGAGQPIDEDVALVVATSGSTGTPKGAMLSAANLVASADATHQYLGGEGQWLLAMPAYHIAGIQVLVRSLIAGYDPAVVDVSDGFSVSEFARVAADLQADGTRCYTSLTPAQLHKAMDTLAGIEALRGFDAVLVGGAALSAVDQCAAKELQINVVTTYGSSETAGGCVYDGRPIPGARVKVEGGRIFLGGPMVARGYRNMPEHEAFSNPGWFATSDGGVLKQGLLQVTGRLDTVIISGGLKLQPEVLEQQILQHPKVREVCVVGVPDAKFGQAIAVAYSGAASSMDIVALLEDVPRWQLPKHWAQVDALPVGGLGKVDRQKVLELFA